MNEALIEYSKELDLSGILHIDALIESHRYLRSLNLELNEARLKAIHQARDHAYKTHTEDLASNTFTIEKLRTMSLMELVELLKED